MKGLIITLIVIIFSVYSLYAQNKTIKGRLISEGLEPVPFVSIIIYDSVEIGKTDLNGFFQISIPDSMKKILFQEIGFEKTQIDLADTCNQLEIIILSLSTYDFKTLRKIDRLRLKRFKKLLKLHKEAFAKGIFKTDKSCYIQKFIPYYSITKGKSE